MFRVDQDSKRWDQYQLFHSTHGPFVVFETGELIVTSRYQRPRYRKLYLELNLEPVMLGDKTLQKYELIDPDNGTVVPKSRLLQRNMLIDHNSSTIIALGHITNLYSNNEIKYMPMYRKHRYAYISTRGAIPAANIPMRYTLRPKLTDKQWKWLRKLREASKVQAMLIDEKLLDLDISPVVVDVVTAYESGISPNEYIKQRIWKPADAYAFKNAVAKDREFARTHLIVKQK